MTFSASGFTDEGFYIEFLLKRGRRAIGSCDTRNVVVRLSGQRLQVFRVHMTEELAWTSQTNIITKTAALLPLQTEETQGGYRL